MDAVGGVGTGLLKLRKRGVSPFAVARDQDDARAE
jgi:hypothetical protein